MPLTTMFILYNKDEEYYNSLENLPWAEGNLKSSF